MISKEEFTSKLDKADVKYIITANTIVLESTKTLLFNFENNSLVSFISGYEMRRVFNVKEVTADSKTVNIVDGNTRYEIAL